MRAPGPDIGLWPRSGHWLDAVPLGLGGPWRDAERFERFPLNRGCLGILAECRRRRGVRLSIHSAALVLDEKLLPSRSCLRKWII